MIDASLTDESRRLLAASRERGIEARVLGGVAIRLLLGSRLHSAFERELNDIDFIVGRRQGRELEQLLAELGWEPEREFNALNGARRLLFHEPEGPRKVDVFVETFSMCHELPLAERLLEREETLPPAELLMTKLQIVELNPKDRGDCYALLLGCPVEEIEAPRIAELAARDWGMHHTFELNLGRLRDGLSEVALDDRERATIAGAVDAIQRALDDAPKSRAWRLRARIGERKRWYEEVEEIDR